LPAERWLPEALTALPFAGAASAVPVKFIAASGAETKVSATRLRKRPRRMATKFIKPFPVRAWIFVAEARAL
jgi:hypothetical protein